MIKNDFLLLQDKIIKEKELLESKSLKISFARLIIGILILGTLLGGYFTNHRLIEYSSLLWLILFIILVIVHRKVKNQLAYLTSKTEVIKRYLARYSEKWKEFSETGLDYVDEVTGVMKDLDLVGNNSLFQYLNVANSVRGKKRLLEKLTRSSFDKEVIVKEQEALFELSNNFDFVLAFETYINMVEKPKVVERIIEEFVAGTRKKNLGKGWGIIKYLIPFLTISSFMMFCFDFYFKLNVIIMPILILGQLIVAVVNNRKYGKIYRQVAELSKCLNNYQSISKLVEQTTFKAVYLQEIQKQLSNSCEAFDKLQDISSSMKQRNNLLAFLLLNGLLLWDVICKERYDCWVKQYANDIDQWLDAIGEFETIISLQVLCHTKDKISFPTIHSHEKTYLKFNKAYHPLISSEQVVANSFKMEHQVCVITGSNMSGKTTFLRTIGINLVLAYAGGVVMADSFDCSLMKIFTSMRVVDDINGISSFYGELLRIKRIVEANRQGDSMIALIDEIFKGTNSNDRIAGALETVKQLSSDNIFTFITTHDFELCELENEVSCSNYHFDESYQDNKIKFDYLIKQGRSQTTNGQYLLKMVGIIN